MLFITPFYFMVGFKNDAELFFRFILMSFLMCLLYSSLSTLWLALLPNQIGANHYESNSLKYKFKGEIYDIRLKSNI